MNDDDSSANASANTDSDIENTKADSGENHDPLSDTATSWDKFIADESSSYNKNDEKIYEDLCYVTFSSNFPKVFILIAISLCWTFSFLVLDVFLSFYRWHSFLFFDRLRRRLHSRATPGIKWPAEGQVALAM